MKSAALILAVLLAGRTGRAAFVMPTVDDSPNGVSQNALLAIWSSTDVSVTAGKSIGVLFPAGFNIPASLCPTTCACIFLRHTSTSAGAWAVNEVTFTAGSYNSATGFVGLTLPAALYPGKFYMRFDTTAGIYNPPNEGLTTLGIVDPSGNTLLSNGFYVGLTWATGISLGSLSGTVTDTAGKAVPAALVMATSFGTYPSVTLSPNSAWVAPLSTTENAHTAATLTDGSYALSLPPGTYSVQAVAYESYNATLQSATSSAATATITSGGSLVQNFTLPALP